MTGAPELYRVLNARMPYHAGNPPMSGAHGLPGTALADPRWWRDQVDVSARLYGRASARVLGTIRWYSASSVLLAPVAESLTALGTALDPALSATTLLTLPDGRFPGAVSERILGPDVAAAGAAIAEAVGAVADALAGATGAAPRALWAIAADSLANRMLWAGEALGERARAAELAVALAGAVGPPLPTPRYTDVGTSRAVRRSSCCLIYEATGGDKCVSCPRQLPEERAERLRHALG